MFRGFSGGTPETYVQITSQPELPELLGKEKAPRVHRNKSQPSQDTTRPSQKSKERRYTYFDQLFL